MSEFNDSYGLKVPTLSQPGVAYIENLDVNIDINMNSALHRSLDTILKFGTVLLIYRLCQYLFFDRKSGREFFDKRSMLWFLFFMIGIIIYYFLVDPLIVRNIHVRNPILHNVINDTLFFGTIVTTIHALDCTMTGEPFFTREYFMSLGVVILAFATYRVVVQPFIPFEKLNPGAAVMVSQWAQFGVFLVVLRILEKKPLLDRRWILSVLIVLLGFTGYDLIFRNHNYISANYDQ